METYVESFTESLTHSQFSEQRFFEDVDFDDTALEEMLHNAHRVHVHHSQREGLSVGQSSSSSVFERTARPVEERTGRPVMASGQELNVGNPQIRTLLDQQKEQILAECQAEIKKHEFQANYDRHRYSIIDESCAKQSLPLNASVAHKITSETDEHPVRGRLHKLARLFFPIKPFSLGHYLRHGRKPTKIWRARAASGMVRAGQRSIL